MGLMDTVYVCAGGGRVGEMGFSTEDVVVVEGGWGRPLWQGRGKGESGREGGLVKPRISMKTPSVFSVFSRRGDTLLVCGETEGDGTIEGEGDA